MHPVQSRALAVPAGVTALKRAALETIFVVLLNEAPGSLRPVQAARRAGGVFEIVSRNDDPLAEHWEFAPGTLVRCAERQMGEYKQLVAVERVPSVGLGLVRD